MGQINSFSCSDNIRFQSLGDMKICGILLLVVLALAGTVQGKRPGKPGGKPGKGCWGTCQAEGTECGGKVKPYGCADGEECCMTGKPSWLGKGCWGTCQAEGTECGGKVKPYGCADGEECCMT